MTRPVTSSERPPSREPRDPHEAAESATWQSLAVQAKKEWQAVVDAVSDLVVLTDCEGVILRCNQAMREALGLPFRRVLGRRLGRLLLQFTRCHDFEFDADRSELTFERSHRVLECKRYPSFFEEHHFGYVFVMRDVTELRRLHRIAASVDMMNNLGHVLSSVRHEIGNPTNALKTALTVLTEGLDEFSREKKLLYIQRCLDDVQRIQRLLDQLRTFNLFEGTAEEPVDLLGLLQESIPRVREDLERQGIELEMLLASSSAVEVLGDARALHQVLLGLISNAVDALRDRESGRIRISLRRLPPNVRLTVTDNGPGIDPAELDKVLLPLHTTKPNGTGLGLAIARNIVTRMNGTIEVGNDPVLGGAKVALVLPLQASGAPDA